jgi:hypothetical protein
MSNDSVNNDAEVINALSYEFDAFCQARHNEGAAEYGHTGFLKNNLFRMIVEELADASNYMRYMYIKLRLMEGMFESEGSTDFTGSVENTEGHEVSHDITSFVSAGGLSELMERQARLEDPR